VIKQGSR